MALLWSDCIESWWCPWFPTAGSPAGWSAQRRCFGWSFACLRNTHGYGRDPADDGGVAWIADVAGLTSRLWSRNENQLVTMQFAPTAYIAIAEFKEKDWTVMLVMPIQWWDRSLPG